MVKINKIYTRTGDDGTTGLVEGSRRSKADPRVAAFGDVDETNAAIGLARLHTRHMARIDAALARIQNDLFDLGSDLATPGPDEGRQYQALRITDRQTEWLEREIDQHNEDLSPLTSFVLPGGSPLAACLHLARTVARRAERSVVALAGAEPGINGAALRYLNRLSDLLFVLSRIANNNGASDVLWEPGRNTGEKNPK